MINKTIKIEEQVSQKLLIKDNYKEKDKINKENNFYLNRQKKEGNKCKKEQEIKK